MQKQCALRFVQNISQILSTLSRVRSERGKEMKFANVLAGFVVFSVVCFVAINFFSSSSGTPHELQRQSDLLHLQSLLDLVNVQNETIHTLELHLKRMITKSGDKSIEDAKLIEISDTISKLSHESEENRLKAAQCTSMSQQLEHNFDQELHRLKISALSQSSCPEQNTVMQPAPHSPTSNVSRFPRNPTTQLEHQCEQRYGMDLVDTWGKNEEIWCASDAQDSEDKSELKCYPYHQAHKKLDGRGPDLVCEASNFMIDFNKISGDVVAHGKPSKGTEYLRFAPGSLQSTCKTTSKYQTRLFMAHHALQMRGFEPGTSSLDADTVVPTTIYLLARDEDCENSFHSTADFMNMLLVYRMLGLDEATVQVMLFDRFSNGPYLELIQKAFSPQYPLLRHTHYKGKVLFKRLVFHLESPAGLIFPKVARPDPLRCHHTSLFEAYRRHVLQAFNLLDVSPPPIPSLTLSLRHRSKEKNVGRVMGNEEEVINVLKKGNLLDLHVVDTAKMSYSEQLKLIRNTNVLIGIHGAGLMFIMFAADEAVLVEIHPSYRQDRHFRHAARMTGKIYMPLRSTHRESCVGSSDTVTVPLEEFERTVDGAVRIARSFDDGLSECGLVCPPAILALDGRLDKYYKSHERKSAPINTHFPC